MKKLFALFLAVALTGCSMAGSKLIDQVTQMSCTTDGGSYYLPRTMVKVVVEANTDATASRTDNQPYLLREVTAAVKQDRRYPYCVDFLKSPTSEDTLIVSRDEDLLLQKISSRADDKSVQIAKSLIQAIFVGITGNPTFGQARSFQAPLLGPKKRFEVEYDPFDDDQAALINDSLREYGYCVVLENARFLARGVSPEVYCDQPLSRQRREKMLLRASADKERDAPPAYAEGIFYRARLPYNFFVLEKKNLQARGGWSLLGVQTVLFENESPIFSVAVDRTYFAHRYTTLSFSQGALVDVSIDKSSELLAFSELPLTIAQSMTAVPGAILQVKLDDTNNRGKLIDAQKALLETHTKYLDSLATYQKIQDKVPNSPGVVAAAASAGADRSLTPGDIDQTGGQRGSFVQQIKYDQCMASCSKDPDSAYLCPDYCQCRVSQCPAVGDDLACSNTCAGLKGN